MTPLDINRLEKGERVLRCGLVALAVLLLATIVKIRITEKERELFIEDYQQAVTENNYVAHALGGVNGKTYTNSKEAIENALAKGFRFFEADVNLTSDDKLVLVHGWDEKDYNERFGVVFDEEHKMMSYDEFKDTKLWGEYTTLDFKDLVDYMKNTPGRYVMLDFGKKDAEYLRKAYQEILNTTNDADVLDRFIVGGHNTEMVETIKDLYDFKLYNLYWAAKENRKDARIDTKEEFLKYCQRNSITSLSTSVSTYETEKSTIEWFKKNGMIVYLYTEDDEKKAKGFLRVVDLVGTNDIGLK